MRKDDILLFKTIRVTLGNDSIEKYIKLDESRIVFTSADENIDVTIIEIKPKIDGFKYFLDVDEKIFAINYVEIFQQKPVYILQYPRGKESSHSEGIISRINNTFIEHTCSVDFCSSGAPILKLSTFKVIGIHKRLTNGNFNEGTLIQFIINYFYDKYRRPSNNQINHQLPNQQYMGNNMPYSNNPNPDDKKTKIVKVDYPIFESNIFNEQNNYNPPNENFNTPNNNYNPPNNNYNPTNNNYNPQNNNFNQQTNNYNPTNNKFNPPINNNFNQQTNNYNPTNNNFNPPINNNYNPPNNYNYQNKINYGLNEIINDNNVKAYNRNSSGGLVKSYAYYEYQVYKNKNNIAYKTIENFNGDMNKILFCLFTGHGGNEVSNYLQENFAKYMKKILPFKDISKDFTNLFKALDEKIKDLNVPNTGATGTVVYIEKYNGRKKLFCANVGNNRCVLVNRKGIIKLSNDHSINDPEEYKRILRKGGILNTPDLTRKLSSSRAFGLWSIKKIGGIISDPHITIIDVNEDDLYLIIGSEKVWGYINDDECLKFVANKYPKEISKKISVELMNRGCPFNIGSMVICFK